MASQPIHFVYVHGTNNNSEEAKQNFYKAVQRLHGNVLPQLGQNSIFFQHTLENGRYCLSPQPVTFFWGDRTRAALDVVKQQLLLTRLTSPWFVQQLRREIALTLHDAVWFEQEQNKKAVLDLMYQRIMADTPPPHNVILMGHSAGSMIVYEFLVYRVPYIRINHLMQTVNTPPHLMQQAAILNLQPTCLQALEETNIFRFNAQGKMVPFLRDVELPADMPEDATTFKIRYFTDRLMKLNERSQSVCMPPGSVKGAVLFGSPLTLFASSIFTPPADKNYFVGQLGKYILEDNVFWLHINHAKDPIGLPIRDTDILQRLEEAAQEPIYPKGGFISNHISNKGGTWFRSAHSWYWNKPDAFAQTVSEVYTQGYTTWYPSTLP